MKLLIIILQFYFNAVVRDYNDLELVAKDSALVYYSLKGDDFYVATGYFSLQGKIVGKNSTYRLYVDSSNYWILTIPNRRKLIFIRGKRLVIIEGV